MASTLDWYGCSTFRLRTGGLTLFLDAYIDRVQGAPGSGLKAEDVDQCDWIVVGHSHFDHLWGAERIVGNTNAKVIGSYETIRVLSALGVAENKLYPVSGGERISLGEGVSVEVFPSLHSCVWSHKQLPKDCEVCIGDLGTTYEEQRLRLEELMDWIGSLGPHVLEHLEVSNQGARGDGGAFIYLIHTPEGTVLYQDTSGHWRGVMQNIRPDVAILAAAGRANVDGEPIQGTLAQFVAQQAQLLRPGRIILGHHDDWLPGFSSDGTDLRPIQKEVTRLAPNTELPKLDYVDAFKLFD